MTDLNELEYDYGTVLDGVPIPGKRASGRPSRFHFHEIGVGQCKIFDGGSESIKSVRNSASAYQRRAGVKLKVRMLDNGDVGVWRTV